MSWEVNLEENTVHHPEHNITLKFVCAAGQWRGMLGPTDFIPEGGMPLQDLPALMKEGDDAFREAKGLPLQSWDFLEDDEEDEDE